MPADSIKESEKKIEKKTFIFLLLFELIFFSLAFALSFISFFKIKEIPLNQNYSPLEIPQYSIGEFLLNFAIILFFILIVIYFLKNSKIKNKIFRAFFLVAMLTGNFFFFSIWFSVPLVIIFTFLVFLILTRKPVSIFHNFALLLAISGSAVSIALRVKPLSVAILISIFSIYDFIAVYKTKHMIKIAQEMTKENAILGILFPNKDVSFFSELEPTLSGKKFFILGAGDFIFPLIFCLSFLKEGIFQAFIMFLFSILGFLFSGFVFYKNQKAIPALPPIAFFCLIGYLINNIFF